MWESPWFSSKQWTPHFLFISQQEPCLWLWELSVWDKCPSRALAAMLLPLFPLSLDITLPTTITLLISLRAFGMVLSTVWIYQRSLIYSWFHQLPWQNFPLLSTLPRLSRPCFFCSCPFCPLCKALLSHDSFVGPYWLFDVRSLSYARLDWYEPHL